MGRVMAEIFDYDDYRDLIKDYYQEHKKRNSLYSFNTLGKMLGLDASHAYYIVQKNATFPYMQCLQRKRCSSWKDAQPPILTFCL